MSIAQNFPALKPSLLLDFASTKQLDNRVTFTRSTPAVYYDGKTTAKAEQNLTLYSQAFDTSSYWSFSNLNITGNTTTAPDGTSTADSLTIAGSVTSYFNIGPNAAGYFTLPANTPTTYSVYVKSNGSRYVYLGFYVSSFYNCNFDLTLGTSNIISGGGTATITSVGNSWYRITWTFTPVASTGSYFYFGIGDSSSYVFPNSFAGTAGQGVYLWGAQVEIRSAATSYTATTTQPITNYIPVLLTAGGNQARFDCNPTTGESLGFLIEAQRTNLCLYSGDYTNAAWLTFNSSKQTLADIAPDGTLTACKLIADTTASTPHGLYQQVTPSTTGVFAMSMYIKAAGYNFACLRISTDADTKRYAVVVNLLTGAVTSTETNAATNTSYAVQSVGNGWYKIAVTASQASSFMYITVTPSPTATPTYQSSLPQFTGDGFSGIYVWGAQIEAGAFATSYIATTSASATRTADVAQMTGTNFSSWFNNAQGTFVAIVGAGNVSASARVLKVSDTDSNRLIDFYLISTPSQEVYSYQNGITSANYSAGIISTSKYLTAVSYATGNISALVNGGSVTTSTGAVVSSVANSTFAIGYDPISGASQLARPIAKIAYYPIQVTSAQLQALTS
tara:strand:- start:971 stop:2827 length:1857 start_codon:yes stop_codon:yes gene_type:complete